MKSKYYEFETVIRIVKSQDSLYICKFLEHIFKKNKILENAKKYIISDLSLNKRSIPFNLGDEKKYNPFLNQNCGNEKYRNDYKKLIFDDKITIM